VVAVTLLAINYGSGVYRLVFPGGLHHGMVPPLDNSSSATPALDPTADKPRWQQQLPLQPGRPYPSLAGSGRHVHRRTRERPVRLPVAIIRVNNSEPAGRFGKVPPASKQCTCAVSDRRQYAAAGCDRGVDTCSQYISLGTTNRECSTWY
jgi:hypothetical protein